MAETSYQMLEMLSFCDQERAYPPSIKITVITFLVNQNYNEGFRGVYFFVVLFLRIRRANVKSNLALVAVLVLESLGLLSHH